MLPGEAVGRVTTIKTRARYRTSWAWRRLKSALGIFSSRATKASAVEIRTIVRAFSLVFIIFVCSRSMVSIRGFRSRSRSRPLWLSIRSFRILKRSIVPTAYSVTSKQGHISAKNMTNSFSFFFFFSFSFFSFF